MSLLAVVAALVAAGGLCLWVSGLLLGNRSGGAPGVAEGDLAAMVRNRNALRESLLAAHQRTGQLEGQLADERAARRSAEEEIAKTEAEMEKAAGELGRAEAELSQSALEIARLKAQLEATTRELADTPTLPPDPLPGASVPPAPGKAGAKMTMAIGYVRESTAPESAAADSALADLDLERVAHAKTRQALEEAQAKLEQLESRASAPPVPPVFHPTSAGYAEAGTASTPPPLPSRERKGAGFQTVSIASRDQAVPGFEHDRLVRAHEQLKLEKERLAAEHAAVLARLSGFDGKPEPEE